MADFNKKQYLDLAGLKAFWGIIKDKFVSEVSLAVGDTGAAFTATYGDGETNTIGVIPMANSTQAGLMSAAQAKTVDEFSDGVAALVPLTAVKVNGTVANLTDRAVNLDFIYDSTAKEIQVVDRNKVVDGKPAVLTKIDATDFIKDGMVQSVTFNKDTNDLEIVFNQDGPADPIIVPLDKLIDVYNAGAGIKIENGNIITVNTNSDYLSADANGLGVTDALWTEVDRRDNLVDTAAKGYANTAETAAKSYTDDKIGTLTKDTVVAEIEAAAAKALDGAKKYTDDVVGELPTTGVGEAERTMTVAEAIAAAVKDASDASDAADKALEDAKDYTDARLGELGTVSGGTEPQTVKGYVDAAQAAAEDYADGLNTAMNTRVEALEAAKHTHDNKDVLDGITSTKVDAWDSAEADANIYTDGKIGTLADGATTVAAAIENAKTAATGYTDTELAKVYAAIEAIPVSEITFENLNA